MNGRLFAGIVAFCCVGPVSAGPQPGVLIAGRSAERPLQAGETQEYTVFLQADDYLAIDVEERGADVILRVLGPDGTSLTEQQTPFSRTDSDIVRMVAAQSGQFRLQVTANSPSTGKYLLTTSAIRPATQRDRTEVAASNAFHTASQFTGKNTTAGMRDVLREYRASIELARAGNNSNLAGEASLGAAKYSFRLDERDKAIEYAKAARASFKESGNVRREGAALNSLGAIYQEVGQLSEAMGCLMQALPIVHAAGDSVMEAIVLHNLAWHHQSLGEYSIAADYYRRALLLEDNGSVRASTLNNVGRLSASLGDLEAARDYHQQALNECNRLDDARCTAETLANLGSLHLYLHETEAARDQFTRVLRITEGLQHDVYRAKALLGLAAVDENPAADRVGVRIQTALALVRHLRDRRLEADALRALGDWYGERGSLGPANRAYDEALTLHRQAGDMEWEAQTLLSSAMLMRRSGDLQAARTKIERAIRDRESLRWQVTRPDLRSTYLASTQDYYDLYIDILMALHATRPRAGYDRQALRASERARARGLIESFAERGSDVLRGSDPRLQERERAARQKLNIKDQRMRRLAADNGSVEQIAQAGRELNAAIGELRDLEGEMRSRNPRYSQLTQPAALSVSTLEQQLDDDTVLIEYWLGTKRSFAWTVTKRGMSSHVLPAGAAIESAARAYFARLTARPGSQATGSSVDVREDAAGQALSQQLLGPLRAELEHRRLVIVRYGALEYIPFAALPVPGWKGAAAQWLIQSHEIIYLPAASVLAALREPRTQEPNKTIAIFADPVFSADDPRVIRDGGHVVSASRPTDATMWQRSAAQAEVPGLNRLRYSRMEADAIASLVTPEQRLEALDFEANRTAALSNDLTRFRFLHFATHGRIDSVHPELSGLVFSAVDEHGRAQDAVVRLHEIFQMSLRADLVVLSACETALGREIKGEGLVGLTRGFMYAGARRVVATLWNVNDRATAEFMTGFYKGVLREHLTAADSLRAAQLTLLQDPRWSSPYYWGGMVLQGDWN